MLLLHQPIPRDYFGTQILHHLLSRLVRVIIYNLHTQYLSGISLQSNCGLPCNVILNISRSSLFFNILVRLIKTWFLLMPENTNQHLATIFANLKVSFFLQKWEAMWALAEAADSYIFAYFTSPSFFPLTFLTFVPYADGAFSWCVDEGRRGGVCVRESRDWFFKNLKAAWGEKEGILVVLPNVLGEEGNKTSLVGVHCMIRWWCTIVIINGELPHAKIFTKPGTWASFISCINLKDVAQHHVRFACQ